MNRRLILIAIVVLVTLALDQGTKQWARAELQGRPATTIVPGYLDFEYHENPGSAFGLLRDVKYARYILIGVGLLALVLVWTMVRQVKTGQRVADISYALVAGGAVGNLIDRVYIGRVVDFILMHFHRKYIWPAYNIADVALVAGVILLVLVLGRKPEAAGVKATHKGRRSGKKKGRR